MEFLLSQKRSRYSGVSHDIEVENDSSKDGRTPATKAPSLKRVSFADKENGQNWFRRQFSTSQEDDSSDDIEYPTAVAAAAFVINSLEESRVALERRPSETLSTAFTNTSRTGDSNHVSDHRTMPKKYSDVPEIRVRVPSGKDVGPASSIKKTSTFGERAIASAPSTKKASNLGDKNLDRTASNRKKQEAYVPKPEIPLEASRQRSNQLQITDIEADAWEKTEMLKIKERYMKLLATINDWEEKKKAKARRRKEKAEGEPGKKRVKVLQKYNEEIERINEIANGARGQAEENRRKEELRVKEKANRYRMTGKLPPTCFCL